MNAAGATRAGGPWTAGSKPPGFVGIHLLTDAPGLPEHEPAVVVARDLHAATASPPHPRARAKAQKPTAATAATDETQQSVAPAVRLLLPGAAGVRDRPARPESPPATP
jgi:hypothetical protein